ncbi:MAG: hypothetical protein AB7S26_18345 [Sandaracinaceae bacterium]
MDALEQPRVYVDVHEYVHVHEDEDEDGTSVVERLGTMSCALRPRETLPRPPPAGGSSRVMAVA